MLNISDSNNNINEKIENNNQILTPPLTPLTPRTLVQTVEEIDEEKNKEQVQNLSETETENKVINSNNDKTTEINSKPTEEIIEKEEHAEKDIDTSNEKGNLSNTPVDAVEKIIISPPTSDEVTQDEEGIKEKLPEQDNNNVNKQDLLTVSPVLEDVKYSSNAGSLDIHQFKEFPDIIRKHSSKYRNNEDKSKSMHLPPPLPRKDLIYNRRSYIEPLYYTKYMDRSKIGHSLILNEGACNTTFYSPSLSPSSSPTPILYTAEPHDVSSMAEDSQYDQSEYEETYNQSFYMMSPSCANIDLDCLKDVKDTSSKKSMSLRLRHSTSSINSKLKKMKKPISKVFSSSSRDYKGFSLDPSEDQKINNTISQLAAQYESLDQFMLDTEQKMKKYSIALSPSELTIQYTVLELMESIYQKIAYVRNNQSKVKQIRESAKRIESLKLEDELNQMKKHGMAVTKDIDNHCGKITELLNQAEVLYYKIWKRVFRQWIECRMVICERACNQVKEKYNEVEKSIPEQIEKVSTTMTSQISNKEENLLSKIDDLNQKMDDKEVQFKDEYVKANDILERGYKSNIDNIKEEMDSKEKLLQDIIKERIEDVVGKLCDINESLQTQLDEQRQNHDAEISKIHQEHEKFKSDIEKRFIEQNETFINEVDSLKKECVTLQNCFNGKLKDQEDQLQSSFKEKLQEQENQLINIFNEKLKDKEIMLMNAFDERLQNQRKDYEERIDQMIDNQKRYHTTIQTQIEKQNQKLKQLSNIQNKTKSELQSTLMQKQSEFENVFDKKIESIKAIQSSDKNEWLNEQENVKKLIQDNYNVLDEQLNVFKDTQTKSRSILEENINNQAANNNLLEEKLLSETKKLQDGMVEEIEKLKTVFEDDKRDIYNNINSNLMEFNEKYENTRKDLSKNQEEIKEALNDKLSIYNEKLEKLSLMQEMQEKLLHEKLNGQCNKIQDTIRTEIIELKDNYHNDKNELVKEQKEFKDSITQKLTDRDNDVTDRLNKLQEELEGTKSGFIAEVQTRDISIEDGVNEKLAKLQESMETLKESLTGEVKTRNKILEETVNNKLVELQEELEISKSGFTTEVQSRNISLESNLNDKLSELQKQVENVKSILTSEIETRNITVENKLAKLQEEFEIIKQEFTSEVKSRNVSVENDAQDKLTKLQNEIDHIKEGINVEVENKTTTLENKINDKIADLQKQLVAINLGLVSEIENRGVSLESNVINKFSQVQNELNVFKNAIASEFVEKQRSLEESIKSKQNEITGIHDELNAKIDELDKQYHKRETEANTRDISQYEDLEKRIQILTNDYQKLKNSLEEDIFNYKTEIDDTLQDQMKIIEGQINDLVLSQQSTKIDLQQGIDQNSKKIVTNTQDLQNKLLEQITKFGELKSSVTNDINLSTTQFKDILLNYMKEMREQNQTTRLNNQKEVKELVTSMVNDESTQYRNMLNKIQTDVDTYEQNIQSQYEQILSKNMQISKLELKIQKLERLLKEKDRQINSLDRLQDDSFIDTIIDLRTFRSYLHKTTTEMLNIKIMDISNSKIKSIPNGIGHLTKLEDLRLCNNEFTYIPPTIGRLTNLTILFVNDNLLEDIPKEIGRLENLETLHIENNKIKMLPEEIGNMVNLKNFILNNNEIEAIPDTFYRLRKLEKIVANNNKIKEISESIENFSELTELDIGNNLISSLPPKISNLENLHILHVNNNQLGDSIEEILHIKSLTHLDLSGNRLKVVPVTSGLENLKNLKELALNDNLLEEIPPEIKLLHNLKRLYLSNNNLKSLPNEIEELHMLKLLDISKNNLGTIPETIFNLENLAHLFIGNNKINSIPPNISKLVKLERLWLDYNQLVKLPIEICQLVNLSELNLESNAQLESLPEGFKQLRLLKNINVNNCSPKLDVAVLSFFRWRKIQSRMKAMNVLKGFNKLGLAKLANANAQSNGNNSDNDSISSDITDENQVDFHEENLFKDE